MASVCLVSTNKLVYIYSSFPESMDGDMIQGGTYLYCLFVLAGSSLSLQYMPYLYMLYIHLLPYEQSQDEVECFQEQINMYSIPPPDERRQTTDAFLMYIQVCGWTE